MGVMARVGDAGTRVLTTVGIMGVEVALDRITNVEVGRIRVSVGRTTGVAVGWIDVAVGADGELVEMVAVWLAGSTITYPLVKSRRHELPL